MPARRTFVAQLRKRRFAGRFLGRMFLNIGPLAFVLAAPSSPALAAPAADPSRTAEAPRDTAAEAPTGEPTLAQDFQTVLTGRGRAYLAARSRLEAAAPQTRELVIAGLDALDAREASLRKSVEDPTQSDAFAGIERDRGRMVALLADIQNPDDAPRFARQLHSALLEGRPADPWRPLLLGLGPAAVPELAKLVGDKTLLDAERQSLLEDLVDVTDPAQLPRLSAQLGQGDRELERALRRALVKRARQDPNDAATLAAALDQVWRDDTRPADARAAALLVRAAMGADATWLAQLNPLAADAGAPFALRVAALSALSEGRGDPTIMIALAAKHLAAPRRSEQRSEVLAWLSLKTLPAAQARTLVDKHKLLDARAPRLATFAWALASSPGPGASHSARAFDEALTNPWPEVRSAAMRHVATPCAATVRKSLIARAGPRSDGGDLDPAVARAAAEALGRCGELKALYELLDSSSIGFEQRGVVARVLVTRDTQRGASEVAARLRGQLAPQLAERFADALGAATAADESVFEALCQIEAALPTAAQSARRSRRSLFPDRRCDAAASPSKATR